MLKEISRVIEKDGMLLSIFPSKNVFMEWHSGLPFIHWFSKDSKVRYYYVYLLRICGFGNKKNKGKSIKEWIEFWFDYLDNHTYFRSKKEIKKLLKQYFKEIDFIEEDYILYRLKETNHNRLLKTYNLPIIKTFANWMFGHIVGVVILAKK